MWSMLSCFGFVSEEVSETAATDHRLGLTDFGMGMVQKSAHVVSIFFSPCSCAFLYVFFVLMSRCFCVRRWSLLSSFEGRSDEEKRRQGKKGLKQANTPSHPAIGNNTDHTHRNTRETRENTVEECGIHILCPPCLVPLSLLFDCCLFPPCSSGRVLFGVGSFRCVVAVRIDQPTDQQTTQRRKQTKKQPKRNKQEKDPNTPTHIQQQHYTTLQHNKHNQPQPHPQALPPLQYDVGSEEEVSAPHPTRHTSPYMDAPTPKPRIQQHRHATREETPTTTHTTRTHSKYALVFDLPSSLIHVCVTFSVCPSTAVRFLFLLRLPSAPPP